MDFQSQIAPLTANSDPTGVADISKSPVFNAYIARAEKEYQGLSATPTEYNSFLDQISKMWATQPNFTKAQLSAIRTPTWIVDADHDEAIKRESTEFMAAQIPTPTSAIQFWDIPLAGCKLLAASVRDSLS